MGAARAGGCWVPRESAQLLPGLRDVGTVRAGPVGAVSHGGKLFLLLLHLPVPKPLGLRMGLSRTFPCQINTGKCCKSIPKAPAACRGRGEVQAAQRRCGCPPGFAAVLEEFNGSEILM